MGMAMEVISGKVTNPGSTFTAWTVATGDSLSVRNYDPSGYAWLIDAWAQGATAGALRVRSPRLHDNVQGIRMLYAASTPVPLLPAYERERLYAQDTLTVEETGGGAEVDCGSILNYYTNLPGADARLSTWAEISGRIVNVSGTQVDITTGATAGDYGGATAINATLDQFKANQDYAILGYVTNTAVSTVGIRSADFANLRVGGPGTNNKIETRDWFIRISESLGVPAIPVFNAANKANTLVDLVATQTATAVSVVVYCAQLRG